MPRGVVPRQSAKTGRHEGVKAARSRPGRGRAAAPVPTQPRKKARFGAHVKGYDPLAPERVHEILRRLDQLYPDVTCALQHRSVWELLVATILSAQSTDVNVNRVTPELFRKYPTVEDFAALKPEQLQPDIRSTGFFRNKSKSVIGAAQKIVIEPGEKFALLTNGFFGDRICDIAGRHGADVVRLSKPWGVPFDQQEARDFIRREKPRMVAYVQAETSSGTFQPGAAICEAAHEVGRRGHRRLRHFARRHARARR